MFDIPHILAQGIEPATDRAQMFQHQVVARYLLANRPTLPLRLRDGQQIASVSV
jgi:hypothetical protein